MTSNLACKVLHAQVCTKRNKKLQTLMCQGKIAGYQGKQNIFKASREKIQSPYEVLET